MTTMTFIKLGELKRDKREFTITKVKESEKAIQIEIKEKAERLGRIREFTRTEWLPKSQIELIEEYIALEPWLVNQKQLPAFDIIIDGPVSTSTTSQDRVQALKEGKAHIGNFKNC